MESIEKILELQRNRKLDLSLNDYIFAFLRITELTDEPYFNKIYGLSEILANIQNEMKKKEEDEPLIGRLVLSLKRANYFENKDFWIECCDFILSDMFDPESEEIYAAVQGFYHFQRKVEEEWQLEVVKQVFKKLEMLIIYNLKQQKYNLRTLGVLSKYMVQNKIYENELWIEIEYGLKRHLQDISLNLQRFVLENRSDKIILPNYQRRNDPPTLLLEEFGNFGYYFATADYCSEMLFHFQQAFILEALKYSGRFSDLQKQRKIDMEEQQKRHQELREQIEELKIIEEEKNFSKMSQEDLKIELDLLLKQKDIEEEEPLLHELVWPLNVNGRVAANLLQYFNFVHMQNPDNYLENQTREWLFRTLRRPELEYSVENLYNIHKALHQLEIDDEEEFTQFMENKLFQYQYQEEDHEINLEHIKEYIEIRTVQEFGGDCNQMNPKVYEFLDSMCEYKMKQFDSYSIYLFTLMIEEEEIIKCFPKFLRGLPQYVNDNLKMFDFEELCYFCIIAHANSDCVSEDSMSFWSNVNLMKEHIKVSTYSRGFKLNMESNFHKLLQHLDIAEFFGGGEQF